MAKVIGIDLGTTFSVAAIVENGRATIIPNSGGNRLTPSVVAFTEDNKCLVGESAQRQAVTNPERTIASIKRRMGSDYKTMINGRKYMPQEISGLILQKVKINAEGYLGEKIERAVVTVPAYFNDRQRQATKDAGAIAGLDILRIINEPTAASLAYGLDREDIHTILIWDLGGGTFDVSILELGKGVFEVKAVNGNTYLGGDDWDNRIIDYLALKFQEEEGIDLREDRVALQRLKEASERAKIELSAALATNIRIPFITDNKNLKMILTRTKFEELTQDLIQKMVDPTKQALSDAGLTHPDVDRVVLVGGSTRMPAVQKLVTRLFDQEPYKEINPDEAVALGAAIQADILTGKTKDVVLVDVTPLSLGIETQGGIFAKIINRNTTIPVVHSQIFTTAKDNQAEVDIHVLQGEREIAQYNMSLGRFQLTDIPPAPRGTPRIEVTFDIDVNGILHVSACDLHTDNEHSIKIISSGGLEKEDIERMIREARRYAEEDEKRKEEVKTNIEADSMIYAAERVLKEAKDEHQIDRIEKEIFYVKFALSIGKSNEIKSKTKELRETVETVYKKINCQKEV